MKNSLKSYAAALVLGLIASAVCPVYSAPGQVQAGKKIFAVNHCSGCHAINEAGGCIGPPLAGVSQRRSRQYLQLRLSQGRVDEFVSLLGHPELFEHPRLPGPQVTSLLAYLETLKRPPARRASSGHKLAKSLARDKNANRQTETTAVPSPEGRRLFLETGCLACHSVGGAGGADGPALDGIGARRSRKYIAAHVSDPQAEVKRQSGNKNARSKMIQADLLPDQVSALTDYLLSLPPAGASGKK